MIRTLLSFTIGLTLLTAASAQDVDVPDVELPSDKETFHLFLLVGQSNMAGRGKITDADKVPTPNVLMLNKQNQWVPAVDPLHFDKPKMVGVGLGRTFAAEVAKASPGVTIGLIPCAVGGSPISCWEPGGEHEKTNTHPYDDTLPRLQTAMNSGVLKGILWHQGEGDSTDKRSVSYEAKLHNLINRLRAESGNKNVPFILGQLGQFPEKPWTEARKRVGKAHEDVPNKIENTAFVSSDGLGHKGDKTHFSAEAYKEFGRRYAKAYLSLVDKTASEPAAAAN